jgi:hypothetical protein
MDCNQTGHAALPDVLEQGVLNLVFRLPATGMPQNTV